MAIQFNCPYCTTQIRVPDSAGGKRGACPRCRAKILVPKVAVKAVQSSAGQPTAPQESEPEPKKKKKTKSIRERLLEGPQFVDLPEPETEPAAAAASPLPPAIVPESAPPGPPLPMTAAIPAASRETATPYARALKRRRRRRRFVWLPVLFGLMLVGGVAVFLVVTGRKKLEGTLEAVVVPDASLPPRTISESAASVDREKTAKVLNYLQQRPIGVLRSNMGLMKHDVTATASGLSVAVYETKSVQFYRVDVGADKPLRDFLKEKVARLDRPRAKELESGLNEFYERSAATIAAGGSIPQDALETLRSRVLINSLVGAAGYHLLANVRGQLYLCMYEDNRGRLYFLLPRGTKKFTLVGRKLDDGTRMFPGKYVVNVEGTLEGQPAKSPEEPESEKKKPESRPVGKKTE